MNKTFLLSLGLILGRCLYAVDVGEQVPDMCWTTSDDEQVCLDTSHKEATVLIYTANNNASKKLIKDLLSRYKELTAKGVVVINLVALDEKGREPESAYLKSWKAAQKIPFVVAASPSDAGTVFFANPQPPLIAIVSPNEKKPGSRELFYKSKTPDVTKIVTHIPEKDEKDPADPNSSDDDDDSDSFDGSSF